MHMLNIGNVIKNDQHHHGLLNDLVVAWHHNLISLDLDFIFNYFDKIWSLMIYRFLFVLFLVLIYEDLF